MFFRGKHPSSFLVVLWIREEWRGIKLVKAVTSWLQPHSIKQLQIFLCFLNSYQRFIRGFGSIKAPLTSPLKSSGGASCLKIPCCPWLHISLGIITDLAITRGNTTIPVIIDHFFQLPSNPPNLPFIQSWRLQESSSATSSDLEPITACTGKAMVLKRGHGFPLKTLLSQTSSENTLTSLLFWPLPCFWINFWSLPLWFLLIGYFLYDLWTVFYFDVGLWHIVYKKLLVHGSSHSHYCSCYAFGAMPVSLELLYLIALQLCT